jgi:hypothetical protein
MSHRRITEIIPVELLCDARGIDGIGITEPLDLEALAWSCGFDTEETYILAAPAAEPDARFAKDRAAVVTAAILQMVRGELTAWQHREHVDMAGLRNSITSLLRDEFNDVARKILNEIRLDDE